MVVFRELGTVCGETFTQFSQFELLFTGLYVGVMVK